LTIPSERLNMQMCNELHVFTQNLTRLMSEKYPLLHQRVQNNEALFHLLIEQLWWAQENPRFTPQDDVLYDGTGSWTACIHREVFRALSRIENFLLLCDTMPDYATFTADQASGERLTEKSFQQLVEQFKGLSETEIKVQICASLISAVSLSPSAMQAANLALGSSGYPHDTVQFSGRTASICMEIYPAGRGLNEAERQLLQACFPDDSRHWRHAFFLENANCLEPLRIQCKNSVDKQGFQKIVNTWLHFWLINAFGFEGHMGTHRGVKYMTENFFVRSQLLNDAIISMLDNPTQDVLALCRGQK
jgi:hypothetical protein